MDFMALILSSGVNRWEMTRPKIGPVPISSEAVPALIVNSAQEMRKNGTTTLSSAIRMTSIQTRRLCGSTKPSQSAIGKRTRAPSDTRVAASQSGPDSGTAILMATKADAQVIATTTSSIMSRGVARVMVLLTMGSSFRLWPMAVPR